MLLLLFFLFFSVVQDDSLTNKLSWAQMVHILKQLALFHAISYHILQNNNGGGSLKEFAESCPWIENGGRLGQFMTDSSAVRHVGNVRSGDNPVFTYSI